MYDKLAQTGVWSLRS